MQCVCLLPKNDLTLTFRDERIITRMSEGRAKVLLYTLWRQKRDTE